MLEYQQAVEIVMQTVRPLAPVEALLAGALGRVLAAPVRAGRDLPPADNAAMDGFACAFADQQAGDELRVVGAAYAGVPSPLIVGAGEALRIMTGAPLPAGCDTVIPFEEVSGDGGTIRLQRALKRGAHVRRQGEEVRVGELLIEAGTVLRSGEIGLLAAAGIVKVAIHPAPRVALLSTGDELVELGETPGAGQIVNSNFHLLAARLREEGCEVLPLGIARDQGDELRDKLAAGLDADLLISTGGVSIGDRDRVQEVLGGFGFARGFWKVAIKPGKPVLFGTVGQTPIFGLPGNPAAAAATFELFARPALRILGGFADPLPPRLRVILAGEISGGEKRQRFIWGRLAEEQGRYRFMPGTRQGSGQNRALHGAQALLPVAGGSDPLPVGSEVDVMLLRLPPGGRTP